MSAEKNIYTHLHLRGNELRGFVFERLESDPDPIDGRIYYNVAKNEFRACISGVWVNIFSIWHVDDDGNITTDKQVIIKNNLIVEGDTSSGGEGEDTPSAGLDETKLQEYLDEHKYVTEDDIAGLIPSNIATVDYVNSKFNSINLSHYATTTELNALANRVVPIETWMDIVGQHITYDAELDAIVINHNLIVTKDTSSGGEGESVLVGVQGISVNGGAVIYPNSEGIVELTISSGGGGLDEQELQDYLSNNKYINADNLTTYGVATQSWVSGQGFAKASALSGYLPLSGGTLYNSVSDTPLYLKGNENGSYIGFKDTYENFIGYYGFDKDLTPIVYRGTSLSYNLIHSGNIGSYKAGGLATPRTIWGQSFDGTGDVLAGVGVGLMSTKGYYYGLSVLPEDNPYYGVRTFLTYDEGSTMGAYEIASRNYYGLTISHAGGVAYDFGNIPSNLSYTVLVNIKANGNVGIGTIDPQYKLDVNGDTRIQYMFFGYSNEINAFEDLAQTMISNLHLNYRSGGNVTLANGGGNVIIGGTSGSGFKLDVYGGIRTTMPIFGYMYSTSTNAAAFIFDKPGSNLTGIGSDGTSDTIRFGACNVQGGWVDYNQKWKFYGDIIVTGDVASA